MKKETQRSDANSATTTMRRRHQHQPLHQQSKNDLTSSRSRGNGIGDDGSTTRENEERKVASSPTATTDMSLSSPHLAAPEHITAPVSSSSSAAREALARWQQRLAHASIWERCLILLLSRWKTVVVLAVVIALWVWSREVEDQLPNGMFVDDPNRPGLRFNQSLIKQRHPIILVPGFITTALEVWQGDICSLGARLPFRQRMFSAQMFLAMLRDPDCFLRHFALDSVTGMDPPGVKVRPDSSFSSADYLLFGFWVWAKMIINLADIGYDPNNMYVASYDWRLNPQKAEERDRYYSRLRAHIEATVEDQQQQKEEGGVGGGESKKMKKNKFVFVCHSYGCNMVQNFFTWVEVEERKTKKRRNNRLKAEEETAGWVDRHVEGFVDIGGPFMGCPKALAAMMSGEVKDTAMLPSPLRSLLDSHFEKPARTTTFRSWLCLTAILPRGGDCVWPHILHLPPPAGGASSSSSSSSSSLSSQNYRMDAAVGEWTSLTMTESLTLLAQQLESTGHVASAAAARGIVEAEEEEGHCDNVTTSSSGRRYLLPKAKSMTVYCFYGVDLPSESDYWYLPPPPGGSSLSPMATTIRWPSIHTGIEENASWWHSLMGPAEIRSGVGLASGDGTVPLVSLGYACRSATNGFAPSVKRVVTTEVPHNKPSIDLTLRGGTGTADHVDIMGNYEVIESLLLIATGNGDQLKDRVVSNIDSIVETIDTCKKHRRQGLNVEDM